MISKRGNRFRERSYPSKSQSHLELSRHDWAVGGASGQNEEVGSLVPLADAATVECDNLAPREDLGGPLRKLLGNPEQALAAVHLGPDVFGMDARGNPEHDQIVHEVGAFLDHRF